MRKIIISVQDNISDIEALQNAVRIIESKDITPMVNIFCFQSSCDRAITGTVSKTSKGNIVINIEEKTIQPREVLEYIKSKQKQPISMEKAISIMKEE